MNKEKENNEIYNFFSNCEEITIKRISTQESTLCHKENEVPLDLHIVLFKYKNNDNLEEIVNNINEVESIDNYFSEEQINNLSNKLINKIKESKSTDGLEISNGNRSELHFKNINFNEKTNMIELNAVLIVYKK
ncbi:hypothetical protein AKUH4B210M_09570 [Apilactobacillus kunkeei]|nr:hypothetical protein AKUH4B210M_09570 [Apilactobacillus kunkeei]